MRISIRSVLVALVAVSAFGAVTASGASALNFQIEGKPLTGTETFTSARQGSFGARVTLKLGGAQLSFECKQFPGTGTIRAGGSLTSEMDFKECAMTEPSTCKLSAADEEEIPFYISGQTNSRVKITNKGNDGAGEEIFGFELVGSGCPFTGSFKVGGYFICELPGGAAEAVEQLEVCKKSGGFLKMGGFEGNLSYTENLKLASGKEWSVVE